jgi:hypothetical protein
MPSSVRIFEILSYASVLIRLVTALAFPAFGNATPIVVLLVFGWNASLIWWAARRRMNWARWILLIWFVVGTAYSYLLFPFELDAWEILFLAAVLMDAVALALVFTRSARPWFLSTGLG